MTKGKIMGIGIVVIILTAVVMVTAGNQHKAEVGETEDVTATDFVSCEEDTEKTKDILSDYRKSLDDARFITIEKVIRTTTEDSDGNSSTIYDSYLVSDVDLGESRDDTENFANAVSAEEYDESLITQVEFQDGFGFFYEGRTATEIYETLLKSEGFDGNLTNVTFDKETSEMTGQNIYVIADEGSIIEKLLPEYESKDVIEKKVYFQTMKENEIEIPDFFVAVIKYREGDKVVERSIYLQITVNHWEEGEECQR